MANPAGKKLTGGSGGGPRTQPADAPREWWRSFHVPQMADLFLVREDERELQATLDFLTRQLGLREGHHVYDQCCGIGSLSLALAARRVRVTGADLCEFFIARAEQTAAEAGANCTFHHADAFEFVPGEACDAAFNWYSSFGYADSDARNRQMLQRAFDTLRPGGRFALDVPNLPALLRGFQRHLVKRGRSQGREVTLIRDCEVDLQSGTLQQLWTWLVEGQPPVQRSSALRLYLPHQIRELLEQCGFEQLRCYGSVAAEPLTLDSPRLLVIARRPRS